MTLLLGLFYCSFCFLCFSCFFFGFLFVPVFQHWYYVYDNQYNGDDTDNQGAQCVDGRIHALTHSIPEDRDIVYTVAGNEIRDDEVIETY